MRTGWVLVALFLLAITPGVRADPAVPHPGQGNGLAQWTFSNPTNYRLSNAPPVPALVAPFERHRPRGDTQPLHERRGHERRHDDRRVSDHEPLDGVRLVVGPGRRRE